ncbi:hypothetical protein BKA69DRAFT_1053908 [Paraphysoderma sedebokerense]|nr:hypothetical protein BKA69DRAFT_1053908 [Paraphysoderma sedebokerense]
MDRLHEKANLLKSLTIDMGNEIKLGNSELDGMNSTFTSAGGLLSSTQKRLTGLLNSNQGSLYCYLTLFIVGVFMVGYWIVKSKES